MQALINLGILVVFFGTIAVLTWFFGDRGREPRARHRRR